MLLDGQLLGGTAKQPAESVGTIVSRLILGGLHHQYSRI